MAFYFAFILLLSDAIDIDKKVKALKEEITQLQSEQQKLEANTMVLKTRKEKGKRLEILHDI